MLTGKHVLQPPSDRVVDLLAVGRIDDAGGELGDAGERAAGRRKRGLDVVERGLGLGGGVAEPGDRAVRPQGTAAAEEDPLAGAHGRRDRRGQAPARKEGRGIERQNAVNRHLIKSFVTGEWQLMKARRLSGEKGGGGQRMGTHHVQVVLDIDPFVGLGHVVRRAAVDVGGHAGIAPMLGVGAAEADRGDRDAPGQAGDGVAQDAHHAVPRIAEGRFARMRQHCA